MTVRRSIFSEMVLDVREGIADVQEIERYTDAKILKEIKSCLNTMPALHGLSSSAGIAWSFTPTDTGVGYNEDVYENVDNITLNYYIEPESNLATATIESVAARVDTLDVAIVKLHWNQVGTTGEPTLDISLDKDPLKGDTLTGSWLVSDSRIDAIESGKEIDLTAFSSSSLSVQWNFPIGSDYKIYDSRIEILLIDTLRFGEHTDKIIWTCCGNIYTKEAAQALQDGSEKLGGLLQQQAKTFYERVSSSASQASLSTGAQALGHDYDRSKHADAAFNSTGYNDGDWVDIVNDPAGVRRLRRIM